MEFYYKGVEVYTEVDFYSTSVFADTGEISLWNDGGTPNADLRDDDPARVDHTKGGVCLYLYPSTSAWVIDHFDNGFNRLEIIGITPDEEFFWVNQKTGKRTGNYSGFVLTSEFGYEGSPAP